MAKPLKQEVVYDDKEGLRKALEKLHHLPPLVTPHEVLRAQPEDGGRMDMD
jgi:3-deoxy-7-phosphoheptulonate synthase